MTQWIRVHDGSYVNAAHVVRVRRVRSREHPGTPSNQRWVWALQFAADKPMIETTEEGWDFGDHLATIVPAQPGQEVVLVCWDTNEPETRPTEVGWITRYPVIAWRVDSDPDRTPHPVLPDAIPSNCRLFIVLPDGKLVEPYVGEHDSVEAMKAALLEEVQRDWDNRQEVKARAAADAG